MLWLCLSLPRLPASALGLRDGAVSDQRGSQRWLITDAPGIAAGTALAAALAVQPDLAVLARNPSAEQETLLHLAHWLYHYGSPVACQSLDLQEPFRSPRARLWFEAGASLQLFGGLKPLRGRLLAELQEMGHAARCAVAPTRAGAALLAECGRETTCVDLAGLHAALANLPIVALPWPGTILAALKGVGLRRVGALFELPRESFARRFGEGLLGELDRLRGLAAEPFDPVVPPSRYARRFELSGDVESVEPLLFPLKRMCAELGAYLRARDSGALSLKLVCLHAFGASTTLTLRFLTPTRDATRMFAAWNERLLREPPEQAVREITLQVDEFATPEPLQDDLFDKLGGRQLDWQQALERVQARLGDHALWTPAGVADHRPERAYVQAAPGATSATLAAQRPLWLLKQPRAIQDPQPTTLPERIESGWWDGGDAARDYYRIERDGSSAWVFRDRKSGAWFLHGYWA